MSDKTQTAPYPPPYHVGPHYRGDIESGSGRVGECTPLNSPQALANAAFIVRACNNYEALLVALKALRADEWRCTVDWGRREPRETINEQCDAAIAKAEATS